jgi:hypothetical protein
MRFPWVIHHLQPSTSSAGGGLDKSQRCECLLQRQRGPHSLGVVMAYPSNRTVSVTVSRLRGVVSLSNTATHNIVMWNNNGVMESLQYVC